ncbi:hypothetical protein VTH06DRAFT_4875 [Thermothelomyces fergusii]
MESSTETTAAANHHHPPPPPPPPSLGGDSLPAPVLTLSKCILRPFHPTDAAAIQRGCDSAAMARYMSYRFPSPYTLEDARRWIGIASSLRAPQNADVLPSLAICDPATGELVGAIGIKPKEDVEEFGFEIGYWIREASWGRGIMTEACRAYCRWLFEVYPKLIRIEADVFEGNHASVKVLEKCGFVHEGTKRKAGTKHGRVFDIWVYGLLREECERMN